MEKSNKPNKKYKQPYKVKKHYKKKHQHDNTKYRCLLCERIIVNPNVVKKRKNYPFGRKSKPQITYEHREDGGVLVVLSRPKKRKKNDISSETTPDRNN